MREFSNNNNKKTIQFALSKVTGNIEKTVGAITVSVIVVKSKGFLNS